MHIVHVIPIARGVGRESLTYFTKEPVSPGMVVSVPLRRRTVPALVISTKDASSEKAALRHAAYALRKTTGKTPWSFFTPALMDAAFDTARYHAGTNGATLHALVPKELWDASVAERLAPHAGVAAQEGETVPERFILQAEDEERFSRYRGLVREIFAQNASVYICVPTIAEGEHLKALLERGIEHYIFLLHSAHTKKMLIETWHKALTNTHPVVIIGTPAFLTLPRRDLHTVIIEHENAGAYRSHVRPYVDLRYFVEAFARAARVRLVLGGLPLRIETLFRHEQGELESLVPPKLHPRSGVAGHIIDMREKRDAALPEKKRPAFRVVSDELHAAIGTATAARGNVFLFTSRRGLAPITVCGDCGNVVTCEDSNEPAVLYRGLERNLFVCQSTGIARSAEERCRVCKSWRLQSLGIGAQRVEDELRTLFPDVPLFLIDSDSVKSHRGACAVAEKFYMTPGAILIGTEMALPYLAEPVQISAVVSADTLLSHPEWRMSEKAFSLFLALRDRASGAFLVQTRRPEEPILSLALAGDTASFYRSEISRRELFRYPPFTVLVKITSVGTPARVTARMKELEEMFAAYKLNIYLPTIRTEAGRYKLHGLLRVPRESWPDEVLLGLLRELPQHFSVQIDPERLL